MGKYKDIDLTNKQKKLVAGDYANLQSNKTKGNVISTIRTIDMGKILGAFPFVSGSTKTKNNAKGGMMKKKGMAKGGMKKKGYAAGGMTVRYKVGGMAKGKMYGSVDNRKKK